MFAEELAGNASRKRQEEARARRRRLKQQEESKKKTPSPSAVTGSTMVTSQPPTGEPPGAPSVLQTDPLVTPGTTASSSKPSAVENALQQRQIRQAHQLKLKNAVRIQSFYRAYRSNALLLAEQAALLSQRLKDLTTLRTLLEQKTSSEYVPPPATVTGLVRQLLFLTKSIPYKGKPVGVVLRSVEDTTRLQQVLDCVVLPGVLGKDENLDPCLTWFASREGQLRFTALMRLCLVVISKPSTTTEVQSSIDKFLRAILAVGKEKSARSIIVQDARRILPTTPALSDEFGAVGQSAATKSIIGDLGVTGAPLDLIQILRQHLLFSHGDPIPADAVKRREACISKRERAQNDVLFQLVLDAVQSANVGMESRRLQARFVTDILTTPLLTWRLSALSVARLLKGTSSANKHPILLTMVSSFAEINATALASGKVATILPTVDIPLTLCPATNTQCLLANLVQLGRICPSINGSDTSKLDYQAGALFFNLLTTLIDVVPLSTFSSRDSAVEWISDGKSHHTPIVLSPVILEQCRLLLVDSYVRDLVNSSIDNDDLDTDRVLQTKNVKDIKHEKDLADAGSSSAATLAANEARVDRSSGFWKSTSKWAKKLTKTFAGDSKPVSRESKSQGMLMNTSAVSRKLAHGQGPRDRSMIDAVLTSQKDAGNEASIKRVPYDRTFFIALCKTYGTILARWGGGGRDDIVKRKVRDNPRNTLPGNANAEALSTADPCSLSLLNVICFSTSIVQTTWALIQSDPEIVADVYAVIDTTKGSTPIRSLTLRPKYGKGNENGNDGAALIYIFVCALSHILIVTDDTEIEMEKPIPKHQLRRCIQVLKKLLYRACCLDDTVSVGTRTGQQSNYFGISLVSSSARTMRDLYDRSSRKPLCIPKLWLVEDLLDKDIKRCKKADEYEALLATPVLRICPFLVSFKRRLKLFERIVTTIRIDIQGVNDQNPFNPGLKPGIPVRIMRGRILEDGLATLNKLGKNLRQRIAVQYVNETGAKEDGIDVGGLFKEFWTDLSAIAFNPNYALFRVTEGAGNTLYPNPSSGAAHGPDHIILFEFLGRILGKALFEGITINPLFAHFFLSYMIGDYNFLHMLPDLSTLDPQLYTNLMFLKTYEGDAEDLCLTFTVGDDDFGQNTERGLIPNGANIAVTNANKHRYIGLMAKYHVCDRVKEQSEAFTRGLWEVIDRDWLRIFNEPELQVLISGASDGKLDVADMKANTRYAGGYTVLDRTVNRFWNVVASFNSKQQADLLRFVTSCERPPPLGFASLNPPFTIQRIGILRDGNRLPTASTCFNVLKLPTYGSEKVLRERLLYAIQSGSGFELT